MLINSNIFWCKLLAVYQRNDTRGAYSSFIIDFKYFINDFLFLP